MPEAKPGGFRSSQVSTWVCAFGKCLLWNPSVTAKATGGSPAVPAPFHKGAFLCPVSLPGGNRSANRSPPCQRGVVWRSQTGGIPRVAGFHMGLCFWKVPAVESLRHGEGHRGLPGRASSLSQGSLFVPGIGTAVEVDAQTKAPLAKGRLVCYSLTAPTRSIMGRRISSRIPGRDSISAGGWGSTTWARRKPFSSRVFR